MPLKKILGNALKRSGLALSSLADSLYVSDRNRLKKEFEEHDLKNMLKTSFPLDQSSVVIDVGGYRGDWASDIYSRHRCRILVLEPVPLFCEHLRKRFADNPDIKIIQLGLGAHSCEQDISLQADGTSFIKASNIKQTVRMQSAYDFFSAEKLDQVGLMKMNIEGSEYELLEHIMASGLISKIQNLLIQFHDLGPESRNRMQKIRQGLTATHKPVFQYDFIWEAWTRR